MAEERHRTGVVKDKHRGVESVRKRRDLRSAEGGVARLPAYAVPYRQAGRAHNPKVASAEGGKSCPRYKMKMPPSWRHFHFITGPTGLRVQAEGSPRRARGIGHREAPRGFRAGSCLPGKVPRKRNEDGSPLLNNLQLCIVNPQLTSGLILVDCRLAIVDWPSKKA
jgi:hypothetical protein